MAVQTRGCTLTNMCAHAHVLPVHNIACNNYYTMNVISSEHMRQQELNVRGHHHKCLSTPMFTRLVFTIQCRWTQDQKLDHKLGHILCLKVKKTFFS